MPQRERLLAIIDKLEHASVALLGDLVLDRFILGTPKRLSREAPVIILRYEGQRDIPGGGANALANLAALGVQAIPIGAVGEDEPGHALLSALEEVGIDTSLIAHVPGFRTPTKVRILGGGSSSLKHQMARYDVEDQLGADGPWRRQLMAALEAASRSAAALAVSDYGYGTVQPTVVQGICRSHSRPRWVCVDSRWRLPEFAGVDGATPNLEELAACGSGPLDTDEAVAQATEFLRRRLGARFLLATRGHRGMTLAGDHSDIHHVPVYGTDQVADVTGAGDTVLAVLTAALAAGADPYDAACLANYAGGIVVTKLGTATVSREELRSAVSHDPATAARETP